MRLSILLKFLICLALLPFMHSVYAKSHTIKMVSDWDNGKYFFKPDQLTIKPGDSITWVNMQDHGHNVIAESIPKGAKKFKSPMLYEKGQRWTCKLDTPGEYTYACHPHANLNMRGKILVASNDTDHEMHDHSHHNMSTNQDTNSAKIEVSGRGVIHSINNQKRSVNITHEPIPSIGWPEMTMDLPVSKRVDLSSFHTNSKVQFTMKLGRDKVYKIIKMSPIANNG